MHNKHQSKKKLVLSRETIRALSTNDLSDVQGGRPRGGGNPFPTITCHSVCFSCNPYSDCCLMQPGE